MEEVTKKKKNHTNMSVKLGRCTAAVPKIAAKTGLRRGEQSLRELRLLPKREEQGVAGGR